MDASALEGAKSWLAVIWWAKLAAAGLVALGVLMEFGSDWISAPSDKTVVDARKLEMARLSTSAAEANARAKEAEVGAGKMKSAANARS